jgi:hypothetical protein
VLATTTAAIKVINPIEEEIISGYNIIESQMPPAGENHVFPNLPFPSLCCSVIIIVPSGMLSVFLRIFCLAIILVEVSAGK